MCWLFPPAFCVLTFPSNKFWFLVNLPALPELREMYQYLWFVCASVWPCAAVFLLLCVVYQCLWFRVSMLLCGHVQLSFCHCVLYISVYEFACLFFCVAICSCVFVTLCCVSGSMISCVSASVWAVVCLWLVLYITLCVYGILYISVYDFVTATHCNTRLWYTAYQCLWFRVYPCVSAKCTCWPTPDTKRSLRKK